MVTQTDENAPGKLIRLEQLRFWETHDENYALLLLFHKGIMGVPNYLMVVRKVMEFPNDLMAGIQ